MFFEILMATHNQGKALELKKFLETQSVPSKVRTLQDIPDLPEIEEKGETFLDNAIYKAKVAAKFSGLPVLADDSGLVVDALDGQPGVYSARFAGEPGNDRLNNQKLLKLMKGIAQSKRTARFICVIALVTSEGQMYTAEGRCEGVILEQFQGKGGFGYDPLFYLPELGKTMAELSLEEKNKVSHRAQALKAIVPHITRMTYNE